MDLKRWRQFDLVLLLALTVLVVYGIAVIHSATCSPDCARSSAAKSWAVRQIAYALVGLGLLVVLTLVDYRVYRALAYPAFGVALFCLLCWSCCSVAATKSMARVAGSRCRSSTFSRRRSPRSRWSWRWRAG